MHRFTRYAVPAALCATLLAASPGLAAAAHAPERPPVAAAKPSIPGTEALLAQVQSLGGVGGLLKPVTDLLADVLKSPDGKIPETDLAAHQEKVGQALAGLTKSLPPAPALPVPAPELPVPAPELPVKPPVALPAPALPAPALPAPALPVAKSKAGVPRDLVSDAVDRLKASVDALVKTAGPCGCSTDAKTKVTDVVTNLVATLVALLTGAGLPGLPPLPVPAPALPAPALPLPAPALPVR
ncbi:hypothetical protein [Streptomyces sp. H27-S2]|uniref:hypothetical protein n=1 Tax=Streptomyces antarcticus TaxID=2996458 RepID=UPI002270B315|nr:hypothetical protein [Streptomyces sp. H27-S2]MCY0953955.1 hypothetical protein [Streptomyces sp. H27-S2]